MPKTIWRFEIGPKTTTVKVPMRSRVLTVASKDGKPNIWIELDDAEELIERKFIPIPTGVPIPTLSRYRGTFQVIEDQTLVFHLYEIYSSFSDFELSR